MFFTVGRSDVIAKMGCICIAEKTEDRNNKFANMSAVYIRVSGKRVMF